MNQVVFFETMLLALNLRGKAYAEKTRVGNRITALWPIHPDRVTPQWNGRDLHTRSAFQMERSPYASRATSGTLETLASMESTASPLCLYAVRKAMASGQMYEQFIRNGARPSLALSSPKDPSDEAKKALRTSAESLYSGPENAGRILFLFGDTKAVPLSITPADAQLHGIHEDGHGGHCRSVWRSLNLLNQTDKSATYASAEQFNR
jgi:phage portal protein BeeE